MKVYMLLAQLFTTSYLFAQINTAIDINPPGRNGSSGMVTVRNPSDIGAKKTIEVDNSSIRGTAFWKSEWNNAIVFLSSDNLVNLKQAKLNLSTNEIYFLDGSAVLKVVDISMANKVIFIDKKDSLKVLAVFQKMSYNGVASFFQVLNAGSYQLLKLTQMNLRKMDYNPIQGKDEYSYDSKIAYFVFHEGELSAMPVANKKQLAALVPFSEADDSWLAANNNKLKGEADITTFLNYYNAKP